MPYKQARDLPAPVKNVLPDHAQHIFMKAYNSAWKEYEDPKDRRGDADREEVTNRVAWSAVKNTYAKDRSGKWRLKQ